MPKNTEYLIAAYGIVVGVLSLYAAILLVKLARLKSKLKQLDRRGEDE